MKTVIAALALLSFAASPSAWQLHEGRANAYVPYTASYSGDCWHYFGGPKGALSSGECF